MRPERRSRTTSRLWRGSAYDSETLRRDSAPAFALTLALPSAFNGQLALAPPVFGFCFALGDALARPHAVWCARWRFYSLGPCRCGIA